MLDALLAPFSSEHRRRHLQFKIDSYYQDLTRGKPQFLLSLLSDQLRRCECAEAYELWSRHTELLQSRFRSDLLTDDASGKQGALRRIFDEFAVSHGQAGRKGESFTFCILFRL